MNESIIIQKLIQVGQMLERGKLGYSGAEIDTKHYLEQYVALRQPSVVEQSEQLICDTCKSGLIDYPDIYRRTCRCGRLGSTYTNTMLYTGQTVRLTTSDEEHRGKYFKVIEVLDDLVKVEWQKRIYFFYCTELEVVKSCI